jgi:hypothetical protein
LELFYYIEFSPTIQTVLSVRPKIAILSSFVANGLGQQLISLIMDAGALANNSSNLLAISFESQVVCPFSVMEQKPD